MLFVYNLWHYSSTVVDVLDSGLLGTISETSWWHELLEVTQGIWQRQHTGISVQ